MTKYPGGINIDKDELQIASVAVTTTAAELNQLNGATVAAADLTTLNGKATVLGNVLSIAPVTKTGAAGQKACAANGVTLITGGTGIADMTLAAPTPGAVAIIRLASLSSGSVVVTTAAGVTFNGTNNTATFDAAEEALMLVYSSATAWAVALNVGGVAFTTVG